MGSIGKPIEVIEVQPEKAPAPQEHEIPKEPAMVPDRAPTSPASPSKPRPSERRKEPVGT